MPFPDNTFGDQAFVDHTLVAEQTTFTSAEKALWSMLTQDQSLRDLIGDRFYPIQLPPGDVTLPSATYQRIGQDTVMTLTGPVDLRAVRFQINVICETVESGTDAPGYEQAVTIAAIIENIIASYQGGDDYDLDINHCQVHGILDAPWIAGDNERQTRFVRIIDVTMWHR